MSSDDVESIYRLSRSSNLNKTKENILSFAKEHSDARGIVSGVLNAQKKPEITFRQQTQKTGITNNYWSKRILNKIRSLFTLNILHPSGVLSFSVVIALSVMLINFGMKNSNFSDNSLYSNMAKISMEMPANAWSNISTSKTLFEFSTEQPAQESMRFGMLLAQSSQAYGEESEYYFSRLSSYLSFVSVAKNREYVSEFTQRFGKDTYQVADFIENILKSDSNVFIGYWLTVTEQIITQEGFINKPILVEPLSQLNSALRSQLSDSQIQQVNDSFNDKNNTSSILEGVEQLREWINFY